MLDMGTVAYVPRPPSLILLQSPQAAHWGDLQGLHEGGFGDGGGGGTCQHLHPSETALSFCRWAPKPGGKGGMNE